MPTTQLQIPREEISFLSDSYIDPNGRVFEWNGGVYRALTSEYAAFCRNLFDKGLIENLIKDSLLIETEVIDRSFQPGDMVLRHRRIPVLSYCFEWPAAMLKSAALTTIDLCTRLAEHDLTIQDGHPWNVLFDATEPFFIDFTSIVPVRDDILWAPYQQFCNFFLFPLYLYSARQDRIARWLLHDTQEGVTHHDLASGLPFVFKLRHPFKSANAAILRVLGNFTERLPTDMQKRLWELSTRANKQLVNQGTRLRFFESLKKEIANINLPSESSHWTAYYGTADQTRFKTTIAPDNWAAKEQTFLTIINDLKPRTVLDLGSNTGRYARLAAEGGSRVIACDTDAASIGHCYGEAKKARANILSLVLNPFNSAPAYGRGGTGCPSAGERFQSELVLALAVIHHVVANQRLDLERIVRMCKSFCTRRLLIEYVPPLPARTGTSSIKFLDDYALDTLRGALEKHFRSIATYDSFPEHRKLLLCEK